MQIVLIDIAMAYRLTASESEDRGRSRNADPMSLLRRSGSEYDDESISDERYWSSSEDHDTSRSGYAGET